MSWISVKIRLPNPEKKEERKVLIKTIRKEIETAYLYNDEITKGYWFYPENKVWGMESVTHWMRLPKLPEEDSE